MAAPREDDRLVPWMCFGSAAALLLVYALIEPHIADNKWETHGWFRFFEVCLHFAIAGFLITGAMELPHFQSYLARLIERVVGSDSLLTDFKYLSRRYRDEVITRIRLASMQALSKRELTPEENRLMENYIYPALDGQQRKKWRTHRSYGYHPTEGDARCFLVEETTSYECHRCPTPTWELPFRIRMKHIAGIDNKALLELRSLRIGKVDRQVELIATVDGAETVFTLQESVAGKLRPVIVDGANLPVSVEVEVAKYLPLDDVWTQYFPNATHDYEIDVSHPHELRPKLYLFGFGVDDPQQPPVKRKSRGGTTWGKEDWVFKSQGWMVIWESPQSETQSS